MGMAGWLALPEPRALSPFNNKRSESKIQLSSRGYSARALFLSSEALAWGLQKMRAELGNYEADVAKGVTLNATTFSAVTIGAIFQ